MENELTKTEIKEIKISQNKLDEFSDEITNASEIIENSMRVIKNVALSEYTINGNFEDWKEHQKIVRVRLRKELNKSIKNSKIIIKKAIQNIMSNIGDVVENMTEETRKTIKPKKSLTIKLISNAEKGIKISANSIFKEYQNDIKNIYQLKNQKPLFESILKHTQTGIDKAPKKIYSDDKKFSFKSYMEMNVRTTVRHEANELLFNASKMNGVVFYICSHFGDSEETHAKYQGKYYYDEDWKSFGYDEETSKKISSYIKSNNLKSYQEVVYKEPFLTTRPNCRHSFRPVVLTDIIEEGKTANQMLGEYKLIKNTYNDKNYIDLQKQRKNERAIRFYKTRLEEHKLQAKENPTDPTIKNLNEKDIKLIKKWQTAQDDFLDSNPILKRDKRRENNKILVQDLGAGYQLGLKIDGKNMYVKEKIKKS